MNYEVTNGLVMAHRRKRLAESDIATILEILKALPITIDSPDADRVMQLPVLALKHQLTAYDAAYVELAVRLELPIATKDAAMKPAMTSCASRSSSGSREKRQFRLTRPQTAPYSATCFQAARSASVRCHVEKCRTCQGSRADRAWELQGTLLR